MFQVVTGGPQRKGPVRGPRVGARGGRPRAGACPGVAVATQYRYKQVSGAVAPIWPGDKYSAARRAIAAPQNPLMPSCLLDPEAAGVAGPAGREGDGG